MEQLLSGGNTANLHNTNTVYNAIKGGWIWLGTEALVWQPVSTSGTIRNLRVRLSGAPGVGKKYVFTLRIDGAPTALTCTISDTETAGADMDNQIAVSPGEMISIECNPDGTPNAVAATWSSIFEGDVAKESLILGGSGSFSIGPANNPGFLPMMGVNAGETVTENNVRQVCPAVGKIKNLYVWLSTDPGTAPDGYRFTLRKGGVSQTLTVTITADDTTGNDTVNEVAVAKGDILTMMVEPLNVPTASPTVMYGMTFVADVDGESIMMGGATDNLHDTNTEYQRIVNNQGNTWGVVDNTLGQVFLVRQLYVLLSGSPGAGKRYVFTVFIGGALSSVVANVSDGNITGNSGGLEDAVGVDDYLTFQVNPAGTPDVRDAYWGVVFYMPPPGALVGPFFCCPFCRDASTHIWRVGSVGVRGIDDSDRFFCEACGEFFTMGGETFWEAHGRLE